MTPPRVSVIIVSRHRPEALHLCLTGLSQQLGPEFEIVVVADPGAVAGLGSWAERVKSVVFDQANIAGARNAGIAVAAGDIIAFIDDDAVPEPTWITRLTAPIAAGDADAAGGYVIGRNGISLQWAARRVRPDGQSTPIDPRPADTVILPGTPTGGVKTEGTNMAFRATVLRQMGGFDIAFRYYLDETDLNMRLARAGHRVAVVPGALVHHGFAASFWRRPDRVPRTLFDIGASLAVYLRKHTGAADAGTGQAERAAQHRRLVGHMVDGRLEPRDIARLLATFDAGWQDGLGRGFGQGQDFASPPDWHGYTPMPAGPVRVFTGRRSARNRLMQQAHAALASGSRAIVYVMSTTALYHRREFTAGGIWVQQGGVFGRSLRTDPVFRFWRLSDRSAREAALVADQLGGTVVKSAT